MARIRSIHPGIYTDESWASVSIGARWLGMGICTEADDNGTFEWKPLQLKMRVFPADNIDVGALLAELSDAGIIMKFEAEGRQFGAVRNFCRFQRPRKPKAWHPTTEASRKFVAMGEPAVTDDGEEQAPVPKKSELEEVEGTEVPMKSEKSPQMEDGGWRREEEKEEAIASFVAEGDCESRFEALWKAYPHVRGRSSKPKAKAAWKAIPADEQALLAVAASRYKAHGVMPEHGPPALDRWLADAKYADWLEDPVADAPPSIWRGPDDVREAFEAALGDEWCRAYLDPSAWQDVPERALIPHTSYAGRKIVREGRAILAKLNLTVLERAA